MGRWLLVLLAPVALSALAACQSQVPLATTYELTYQQKMQAAAHWQVLARDIADQVALRSAPMTGAIVIVSEGPPTAFSTALDDMLVTEFVTRGFAVRDVPSGDTLELRYKTQIIRHGDPGFVRPPPGTFTALTAGVLAVREVVLENWTAGQAMVAAGAVAVGADIVDGFYAEPTGTELIVTTSLLRDELYVARYTDIYYLPEDDADLYEVAAATDDEAPFVITYDSWLRSLSDVRAEATARCQSHGMWAMLLGRDISQRMQTAEFRCYAS